MNKTTIIENSIKTELTTKGVKEDTADLILEKILSYLLEEYGCSDITQLLKVEVEGQVAFVAFTAKSGAYIAAFDKRSCEDCGEGCTIPFLLDAFREDKSLKDLFYSTLELGSIEDKLYAAINNPDEWDIDGGDKEIFDEFVKFSDRIPESLRYKIITQVEEVNGILVIKAMNPYYPKYGTIYFVKGDKIKGLSLLGDNHIYIKKLMSKADLIIGLFEDIEEPQIVQLLGSMLRYMETKVRVKKDNNGEFTLTFKTRFGDDILYHIGDTSYILYEEDEGLSRIEIEIPDFIKESKCFIAYNLLDAIKNELKNNWKTDEFFELDENDKFQLVRVCEEVKE